MAELEQRQQAGDAVIANGWHIDASATPETLLPEDRARFALAPDETFRQPDVADGLFHGIVPGGEGHEHADGEKAARLTALSEWAVFTTGELFTAAECDGWVARADGLSFEQGDFIFKTGNAGYERAKTGARRFSSTLLVHDSELSSLMEQRLRAAGGYPEKLADGRCFRGVRQSFLVTKYAPGQYFAPHFDGGTVAREDVDRGSVNGCVGAFTCVLYLTDDFVGGATLYLSGQGSEVGTSVAVKPRRGCAAVHRTLTVLHAGARLEEGPAKYIMQFGLMYDAPEDDAAANKLINPLRWGA